MIASRKTAVRFGLAALALSLAGCSKEPQPEPQAVGSETPDLVPTSETVPAAVPTPEPSDTAMPEPTSTGAAEPTANDESQASAIPSAIRGRWGLVPKDCTSKLGDAKGLITVSAKQIKFYEAVARLGKVKAFAADSIRGTYDFSGEGQTWTLDVALDLQNGGKTLVRRDTGKDAAPEPLTYTRCA